VALSATLLDVEGRVVGRVVAEDVGVSFVDVPADFVHEWTTEGIVGPGSGPNDERLLYPQDGEAFVRALPTVLSGTYLRAELGSTGATERELMQLRSRIDRGENSDHAITDLAALLAAEEIDFSEE